MFLFCSKIIGISVDGDNTVKLCILCHTKLNNILILFLCKVKLLVFSCADFIVLILGVLKTCGKKY